MIVGDVLGKRTLLSGPHGGRSIGRSSGKWWHTECVCGKKAYVREGDLLAGRYTACGSCAQLGSGTSNATCVPGHHFNIIKRHAARTGKSFTVTIEFLCELWQQQGGRCALSGMRMEFAECATCTRTASLDRIDSEIGYEPGNVQWLHRDINQIKSDHEQAEFIRLCRLVAERNQ